MAGIAVLVALGWITFNTLETDGPGGGGVQAGAKLPPFAAPLATARLEGDATVARKAGGGHPAACDVRGREIVNSCALAERGPVVVGFYITLSGRCRKQVDVLDRVARRHPGVGFVVVAIRGSRSAVRDDVRERGWRLPVAWDRDGAVANAYAVSVCPAITLARRGGTVRETLLGVRSEDELSRAVAAL
jgi:hypothetical protein